MELKRLLDGPESGAKRVAEGPLTPEEIELFQKEAIFRQMKAYQRERDELQAQLAAVTTPPLEASIRKELERVTEQYLEACRKIERLKSPLVARVTQDPVRKDSDGHVKAEEESNSATPQPASSSEESQKKIQELTEALDGEHGVVAKQNEQLKLAEQQVISLEGKIRDLELQVANLPEEAVRKSDFYIMNDRKIQDLTADNVRLEQELQRQQTTLGQLQGEQAFYEKDVREKYDQQKQNLEKQLEQMEADVSRIRGVRDELMGELNVKRAAEQELIKQTEALKERLELAEAKISSSTTIDPAEVDAVVEGKSEQELRELAAKLARQNKAFAAEIPGLEQAFAKAHARANQKIIDQAAVDAKLSALNTAKVKADEKYFGAMRARDALNIEYQQVKAALAKSSEVINNLRAQEQKLVSNTARVQRQLAEAENKVVQVQRAQAQVERRRNELEQQLAAARHEIQKLQSQLTTRDGDIAEERTIKRNLEQQIEKLKKQVDVKQLTSGMGSAQAIQEQIESLRSIALCSLCTKNWKDTAIKVCGHVFCNDCAMARLNARMRKCPLCNSQFGQNDLLQVHL